jgi:hypothetical protein
VTCPASARRGVATWDTSKVGDTFDPSEMLARFAARAEAVKKRGLPPIEGPERQRFAHQAALDYQDYAMLADATAELDDGILTLRVDLRPPPPA